MKLFVKENMNLTETEVEIRCQQRDQKVTNLINLIKDSGNMLLGEKESGSLEQISLSRILYFEAVDRYVFAYTTSDLFRIKQTLYELESKCTSDCFVRVSKSVIVNIRAVKTILPEDSRRIKLLLRNGEWVIVSRNYVNSLKTAIGMKGGRK